MRAAPVVLDERDPVPVRARIGALLRRAERADFAVSRVRLAALDLTGEETARVGRCRVLLGRLDAGMLRDAPEATPPGAAERLAVLRDFAASGRLEVRAAGMAGWAPDFSVYAGECGPVVLLGAHYFGAPDINVGPSFTAVCHDLSVAVALGSRFEELWVLGHDVLPAIIDVIGEAHALAVAAGGGGGGRHGSGAGG